MAGPNVQSNVIPAGMLQGMYYTSIQKQTNGQSAVLLTDQSGRLQITEEGLKYCYRACAVAQTLYSTAAAVLLEIKGSATMTVRIKKITLWAQAATKFYAELTLGRCTGVSAGAATSVTPGQNDINDPVATAVINYYTAAATSGAGFAVMGGKIAGLAAPSASMIAQPVVWDFCINNEKPLILRGTGDVLEIYNNTTALGAGTFGFDVLWEEDNS
jgi:hypothetical protein